MPATWYAGTFQGAQYLEAGVYCEFWSGTLTPPTGNTAQANTTPAANTTLALSWMIPGPTGTSEAPTTSAWSSGTWPISFQIRSAGSSITVRPGIHGINSTNGWDGEKATGTSVSGTGIFTQTLSVGTLPSSAAIRPGLGFRVSNSNMMVSETAALAVDDPDTKFTTPWVTAPPVTPTFTTVNSGSSRAVAVSWASDGADTFKHEYSLDGTTWNPGSIGSSWVKTNVGYYVGTPGATVHLRVTARNSLGDSATVSTGALTIGSGATTTVRNQFYAGLSQGTAIGTGTTTAENGTTANQFTATLLATGMTMAAETVTVPADHPVSNKVTIGSTAPTGAQGQRWALAVPSWQAYARVYFMLPSIPAADMALITYVDASNAGIRAVQVTSAGKLYMGGSTSTTTLSTATWYRLEVDYSGDTNSGQWYWVLYLGESTTPLETGTVYASSGLYNVGQGIASVIFGPAYSSGVTSYLYYLDDPAVRTDGVLPGPSVSTLPRITSKSKDYAATGASSQAISLYGVNFAGVSSVTVDGASVSWNGPYNNNTQINATLPSKSAGTYDIVITATSGVSDPTAAVNKITYESPAAVTSVSPSTARPGDTVTLTGTGFSTALRVATGNTLGDNYAQASSAGMTVNSDTQITYVLPATALPGHVTVFSRTQYGSPHSINNYLQVLTSRQNNAFGGTQGATFGYTENTNHTANGEPFTQINGAGVWVYDTGLVGLGYRAPAAASAAHALIMGKVGVLREHWTRMALKLSSLPATTRSFLSSNIMADVFVTSAGIIGLYDRVGNSYSNSSLTISTGTWYRVEVSWTPSSAGSMTGTVNMKVYSGNTNTLLVDHSLSNIAITTGAGLVGTSAVLFGIPSLSPNPEFVLDDLGFSTIGPLGTSTLNINAPSQVVSGNTVVLTGSNLQGTTSVRMGPLVSQVECPSWTVDSATQITAVVPTLTPGNTGYVSVTNAPYGSATSGTQFTVLSPPSVTAVSPSSGSMNGGTAITLTGTGFTGATAVTIDGQACTGVTVVSDTQITATTPYFTTNYTSNTARNVTVTNSIGTSSTGAGNVFTINTAPRITSVSPSSAHSGQDVIITGVNFTANVSNLIRVNAAGADAGGFGSGMWTRDSTTQITLRKGWGGDRDNSRTAAGPGGMVLVDSSTTYRSNAPSFFVRRTVSQTFDTGSADGTAFTQAVAVENASGDWIGVSNGGTGAPTISTNSPIKDSRSLRMAFPVAGDFSNTSFSYNADSPEYWGRGYFRFDNIPTTWAGIVRYRSTSDAKNRLMIGVNAGKFFAQSDSTVLQTGTYSVLASTNYRYESYVNFSTGAWSVSFYVGDSGTVTETLSGTSALVASTGLVDVLNIGQFFGSGPTYTMYMDNVAFCNYAAPGLPPVITSMPNQAASGGSFTVTGTDFTDVALVTIRNSGTTADWVRAANWVVNSSTSITVTMPTGLTLNDVYNVQVWAKGGRSVQSASTQVTIAEGATVTAVSDTTLSTAGGQTVVITGTNFTGATAVQFGGTNAASFTVNSATQITATTPARSAGTVDVTVTTGIGTSPTTGTGNDVTFGDVPAAPTGHIVSGITGSGAAFDWNDVSGATAYDLELSNVSDFSTVSASAYGVGVSTHTWISPPLNSGTLYYWRVRGTNAYGNGAWANGSSFSTLNVTTLNLYSGTANAEATNTAALLSSVSPSAVATLTDSMRRLTGWDSINGLGTSSPWAALGSEPGPAGSGWQWESDVLDNKTIVAGNHPAKIVLHGSHGGTLNLKAKLYKRDSPTGSVYTLIGTGNTVNLTLTTTPTEYTSTILSAADVDLDGTEVLYLQWVAEITVASTNNSGVLRHDTNDSTVMLATAYKAGPAKSNMVHTSTLVAGAERKAFGLASLTATSTFAASTIGLVQAAADLTATSVLAATAVRSQPAAVGMTSSSTLTAGALRKAAPTAGLTATSTLVAGAERKALGAADLGLSISTMVVVTMQNQPGAADMTATSTLLATGSQTHFAAADMGLSISTLAASATRKALGTSTLTATSTLVAGAVRKTFGAADMGLSISTLDVTALRKAEAAVTMDATSTLSSAAGIRREAAVDLVATSTLTSAGVIKKEGLATLVATSDFVVSAAIKYGGAASLTATSTFIAGATARYGAGAAMTATSVLAVTGKQTFFATATLTATSTLTTSGVQRRAEVVVTMTATSTMVAAARQTNFAAVAMTAESQMVVVTIGVQAAFANFVATSTLTSAAIVTEFAAAVLVATSTLNATGKQTFFAAAALTAFSTMVTDAIKVRYGLADMTATSAMTAGAIRKAEGVAALSATSVLSSAAIIKEFAGAILSATSTLLTGATAKRQGTTSLLATSVLVAAAVMKKVGTASFVHTSTLVGTAYKVTFIWVRDPADNQLKPCIVKVRQSYLHPFVVPGVHVRIPDTLTMTQVQAKKI